MEINYITDRAEALERVLKDGLALKYMSSDLINDRQIVITAVTQNGTALYYTKIPLRRDPAVVLRAILQDPRAVLFVDLVDNTSSLEELLELAKINTNLIVEAKGRLTDNGYFIKSLSRLCHHLRDKKITKCCDFGNSHIVEHGIVFKSASKKLKDDYDYVLDLVETDGTALIYASDRLRDNEDIVVCAVLENICAIEFASKRLRNNINYLKLALFAPDSEPLPCAIVCRFVAYKYSYADIKVVLRLAGW